MTVSEVWVFLQGALPLFGIIGALLVLLLSTKFVRHNKCDEHRKKIEAVQAELEKKLAGLPSAANLSTMQETVAELKDTAAELKREVAVLGEALKGQNELHKRLEDWVYRVDAFLREVRK